MPADHWILDQSDGELLVHTDVTGRAARFGHRLTIRMSRWQATVHWADDQPVSVEAHIGVDGLQIVSGEGGVTPLSPPEKIITRTNALACLDPSSHPAMGFHSDHLATTADGYDVPGSLEIHGTTRPHVLHVVVAEEPGQWRISFDTEVRQSDFGVRPYSLMMGSLKVVDEVRVSFTATRRRG